MTNGKLSSILVITFVMFIASSKAVDYCKIKACKKNQHTACIYKSNEPSKRCTGLMKVGLSDAEKRRIVYLHNRLRQRVADGKEKRGDPGPQPGAGRMPKLVWDNELAFIAQKWANQCDFGYDECRNIKRGHVGQNIGLQSSRDDIMSIKMDSIIYNWYNEVKDFYKYDVTKLRKDEKIGHYVQLVWAKTQTIGCGAVKYKYKKFHRLYLVCNYGPAGNVVGEQVYEPIRRW